MPPVSPISPSTASTGGLPSFVGSGTTSSVFSHDQAGYITYKVVELDNVCNGSSYDSSTGLGTSGYIHFAAGGYTHATSPTQPTYHHTSTYYEILVDSPIGVTDERADDAATLNAWIALMNTNIRQGGLECRATQNGGITGPEYGWETRLLCP